VAVKKRTRYQPVLAACNPVIPYQTSALWTGNSREEHFSDAHDTNHYDTIHAEMNALVRLSELGQSLRGKTLFLTILPCPNCARTISQTGVAEIVYELDHSDGYGVQLLEQCGVKMRKVTA
jgi:deoxycytidylate deaminase